MAIQTPLRLFTILLLLASTGFASSGPDKTVVPVSAGIFGLPRELRGFSEVRKLFGTGSSIVDGAGLRTPQGTLDTINAVTEMLDVNWDPVGEVWTNNQDMIVNYDTLGREIERTISMGFMNFWMPQSNTLRTYDVNGRLSRILFRGWNGSSWQISVRDTVFYDVFGSVSEERVDLYNGSGWDPYQRYMISYNTGRMPVELLSQSWSASSWNNASRITFGYDSVGQYLETVNQTWTGGGWVNSSRQTFTWDGSGNRTGELDQTWAASAWDNEARYTRVFDGSNYLVEETLEQWSGSAWVNDTHETYTNNSDGYAEVTQTQFWDGVAWTDDKIIYGTFDGLKIVEELTQTWTGTTWINFHMTSWSWQQYVTPTVTQEYPVIDKWNMVSVPLLLTDYTKTIVYPTSVSSAFAFDAGYSTAATLENGRGYWLKFDGAQAVPLTGLPVTADTFAVSAGWNMIGSIGVPVAAASVGSIPGGLVSSAFFAFDNGYGTATTIEPGKGYWVKMSQAGQIILSGAGNTPVASRLRMELQGEQPPAPPTDNTPGATAPSEYALEQNYPNPFNPVTTIRYSLPASGRVVVAVFNMIGQEVARLVDGIEQSGEKVVSFDATELPSGVYTYRVTAGTFTQAKKMLLVK